MKHTLRNVKAVRRKVELPEKLWELAELALHDIMKVNRMKGTYRIDMSDWHVPDQPLKLIYEDGYPKYIPDKPKCSVCFAGAILAMTFKIPLHHYFTPWDEEPPTVRKFAALNELRKGQVIEALAELGYGRLEEMTRGEYYIALRRQYKHLDRAMPKPEVSFHKFKVAMKALITDLKAAHL